MYNIRAVVFSLFLSLFLISRIVVFVIILLLCQPKILSYFHFFSTFWHFGTTLNRRQGLDFHPSKLDKRSIISVNWNPLHWWSDFFPHFRGELLRFRSIISINRWWFHFARHCTYYLVYFKLSLSISIYISGVCKSFSSWWVVVGVFFNKI